MQQLKTSLEATGCPVEPLILRELGGRKYIVVAGESRGQKLHKGTITLGHAVVITGANLQKRGWGVLLQTSA